LPDHSDHRTNQRCSCRAQIPCIDAQQDKSDNQGDDSEHNDSADTFQQVTDDLGKTDDMHAYIVIFIALSNQGFQVARELQVIQPFAGCGVHIKNWNFNNGRLIVVCHHTTHDAGPRQVQSQLLQACL